uniref:Fibronectin type-III domain-containing protein n=1 Tax=Branchiostoma floridae TaxID=7739 RepID=C3ZNM9_BRAFL|eukprot:XP_002589870.1 hypothetical protein BRAFLDRAFT_100690 [Branchiostoma floridae]
MNFTFSHVTENSAIFHWQKPVRALVAAYRVWLLDKETALTVSTHYLLDSATSTAFTYLIPATEYVVAITCISLSVEGPQASVTIITDTDPPRQLLADDIGYSSLALSWIPPVAKLSEYQLTYSSAEQRRRRRALSSVTLPGDISNYWLHGLVPATQYTISLTAVSRISPAEMELNITELFPTTKYIIRIEAVSMHGRSAEVMCFGTTADNIDVVKDTTTSLPASTKLLSTTEPVLTTTAGLGLKISTNTFWLDEDFTTPSKRKGNGEMDLSTPYRTLSPLDALQRLKDQMDQSNGEVASLENVIGIVTGINSLLQVNTSQSSSAGFSPELLRNAGLSLEQTMERTANNLLAMLPATDDYMKAFENDDVAVAVARSTRRDIMLESRQVNVSASPTYCNIEGGADAKMIVMERNLFSWNASTFGQNVTTPVTMFSWGSQRFDHNCSVQMNLSQPVESQSTENTENPRRKKRDIPERGLAGAQFALGGIVNGQNSNATMVLYAFDVPADTTVVVMQLSWWDPSAAFRLYFRYDTLPTEEFYDEKMIVEEEDTVLAWRRGTNSARKFVPNIKKRRGRLYVGIQKAGMLVFGTHMKAYTNVLHTNFALFEMLLGRFFAEEILESNRYIGPIFFTLFMILIFILLVNFLVTIICDAIATGVYVADEHDQELADYIWRSFQGIFGIHVPPPKYEITDEMKETELNTTFEMIEEALNETLDVTSSLLEHIIIDKPSLNIHDYDIAQHQFSKEPLEIKYESEAMQPSTSTAIEQQVENLLKAHEEDTARYEEVQNKSRRRAEAMLKRKLAEKREKTQTMVHHAQEMMEQHAAYEERLDQQQKMNRRLFQSKLRQKMALRGLQKRDDQKQ